MILKIFPIKALEIFMVQSFKCDYTRVAKNVYMCNVPIFFYRFYDWMEISVINLRTMHNYNKLRNDKNVHFNCFLP